jgi:peptidylprolyl isomerase
MMPAPQTTARERIHVRLTPTRLFPLTALIAFALLAPGCGDDNSSTSDTAVQTQTQTQTQPTQTTPPPTSTVKAPKAEKVTPSAGEANPDRKPKVPKGEGDPPSKLVAQDLIVGTGKRAKAGDNIEVQYVGVLFKNGKEFDASWAGKRAGRPFPFNLGGGQVIPGWDQGIVGMKVGGRRKLIIPADLAYGAQGFPPDIPPDSALIFDVDLEKITR